MHRSSDHIGYSDNSNSSQHYFDITNGRNIDLLGWDSDRQTFSPSEFIGSAWESHGILIDMCILYQDIIMRSYGIIFRDAFI